MRRLVILTIIIFTLFSCKKEYIDPIGKTDTKELVASSSFDWKTNKDITLKIYGMDGINPGISNILYVKSSNDDIYYKKLLFLNKDYTITFKVPSNESGIYIVYGDIKQKIELNSNILEFKYLD